MNFVCYGMSFLRYFMPLIIEGNKRGVASKIFINPKYTKYDSPCRHYDYLTKLASVHNFSIHNINEIDNHASDITFFIEINGVHEVKRKTKKVVLTSMRDFTVHYPNYVDSVDNIVFCSKFFAEHYGTLSNKNLYLGSSKYDVVLKECDVRSKYEIDKDKIALFVFPLFQFLSDGDRRFLLNIYDYLRRMGYHVIVKSRGKNHVTPEWRADQYVEDYSWFPHTTMELLHLSDIVINFDSTTIKECVMMDTPLINFKNKPHCLFSFLYNDIYSSSLKFGVDYDRFSQTVERLTCSDFSNDFHEAREKFLFQPTNVSAKILEEVL